MATRTAKLNIEVGGEQQYKQAIAEINRGNQVLNAEMKKLAEQYRGNENSMEALTAKSDLLQRQLQQQRDKVQTLREAVQNAATQYGEADRRTQSWQTQLLNAERDEIKLERALRDTNDAISDQGDATEESGQKLGKFGDQIDEIVGGLGIRLPSAAKDALNDMEGFSVGTVAAFGAAATAIGVAYKAASALHDLTKEAAAEADALLTRSAQTGLDTSLLQGLEYASRFLDFEGIDQSLVKLTASMDKARDGAEKQAEAFQTLGVSVTEADGQLRDNWDTFKDVIDALGDVQNATERDALANDIFGKSYSELKPLIDAGSESLQGYIDKAVESGYVMDHDQIEKLGEVDDAVQESEAHWEALKNKIAVEWAPASIEAMNLFSTASDAASEALIGSGLFESFEHLIESTEKLGNVSIDFKMPNFLNPISTFSSALDGLGYVIDGVTTALEWLEEKANRAWDALRNMPASAVPDDVGYYGGYNPALPGNAAGDTNWRGGLTWVGEQGPELVSLPQGSRIYSNPESERIAAGTDTRAIESLLSGITAKLQRIDDNLSDMETVRRMYGYG